MTTVVAVVITLLVVAVPISFFAGMLVAAYLHDQEGRKKEKQQTEKSR